MTNGSLVAMRIMLFLMAIASLASATVLQALGEMSTPAWSGFTAALGAFVGVHINGSKRPAPPVH